MRSKPEGQITRSAYAGRWIAQVQGRVVGHGGTPKQARLAARLARYKEEPEIDFVPPMIPLKFGPLIQRILPVLGEAETYLAGGAVRDALLGQESHDFDFAVRQNAIQLARSVAKVLGGDFYILDPDFEAARVILKSESSTRDVLDFAVFRGEDIDADLAGRDFTINAMGFDPRAGSILDPLGGATDLRSKVIRACSPTALLDDPARVLRGVRQAAAFGFKIAPETRQAMREAAPGLPKVSPERQRDELFRILDGPTPDAALKALDMLGAIPYFLPELSAMKGVTQSSPHVYDVWEHTLAVLRHLGNILTILGPDSETARNQDLFSGLLALKLGRYRTQFAEHFSRRTVPDRTIRSLLYFGALYHDVAKPATRTLDEQGQVRFLGHEVEAVAIAQGRGIKYNLSHDETSRIKLLVGNHMRFSQFVSRMQGEDELPSRRATYRFFHSAGDAGIDLIVLGLADQWGVREHTLDQETWDAAVEVARFLLENLWERPQESVAPPRLLSGDDVIGELGVKPGPIIGELLEAVRELQADGEIPDHESALTFARAWLEARQA